MFYILSSVYAKRNRRYWAVMALKRSTDKDKSSTFMQKTTKRKRMQGKCPKLVPAHAVWLTGSAKQPQWGYHCKIKQVTLGHRLNYLEIRSWNIKRYSSNLVMYRHRKVWGHFSGATEDMQTNPTDRAVLMKKKTGVKLMKWCFKSQTLLYSFTLEIRSITAFIMQSDLKCLFTG